MSAARCTAASVISVLEKQMSVRIQTPDGDDRAYSVVRLDNGLECLLVSDPTTDKAAAAMDVHVGHLCDPEVAPGLAHFCEHLLFMGNERYPSENEYSKYLAAHGGSSNAFTAADHTNYYFDVKAEYLEGALDRFSQFFVSPLFDPSCTDREMKAVDSEHKKNLQSDSWRIYQLQKDLMDPTHPFCKFGTGNLETLKEMPESLGIDVRQILLDFYDKFYSANIMRMVVLGKEPIDQLKQWVIEKASGIKNKKIEVPSFPGHPLSKNVVQKLLKIKPVKDMRSLQIVFPLPDLREQYLCKPSGYISHLIGHESEGSVLALLKQKGWALELSAGSSSGAIGFDFFKINVNLTAEGTNHWEEIVVYIFQYIQMIKDYGVQNWVYDECKSIADIKFRFMEKRNPSSFVSRVAGDMHDFAEEHILSGPVVMFQINKSQIEGVLNALTVDNFRINLVSPDFESLTWSKAKWYGTEYLEVDVPEGLRLILSSLVPNPSLHLPMKNEFIPANFVVSKSESPVWRHPMIISDNDVIRLWFKKDDTFWVPKAKVMFMLKSPISYSTPATCVMTRLYTDCLMDALSEYSYYAHVAGLDYYISNSTEGIELSIEGYNDKLPKLLERILLTARSLKIKENRFEAIKEELIRTYRNWSKEQPYSQASFFSSYVTQERLWTSEDKLAVLEDISASDVLHFFPKLLARLHIEGLIFGNFKEDEAVDLGKTVLRSLDCRPLPELAHHQVVRTLILPIGKRIIYSRELPDERQVNSGFELLVQVGDVAEARIRTNSLIFAHIAKEPCFNVLRTQEQLGYIVGCGVRKQTGMISFRIIIQSERSPQFLETRAEQFLRSMRDVLTTMTAEEYQKNIVAVAFNLREKDKNMSQELRRHWSHISSRYYAFEQDEDDAQMVLDTNLKDLVDFFDKYISPDSPIRRSLSIHMISTASSATNSATEALTAEMIIDERQLALLKQGMPLGPSPVPVMPLAKYRVGSVSKM
ncbi:Insulinase (Peptidase M16) [Entophlyctis luteolus]|nr:Insulinase (Peptidase M16) [Entophlyctis luteolus]